MKKDFKIEHSLLMDGTHYMRCVYLMHNGYSYGCIDLNHYTIEKYLNERIDTHRGDIAAENKYIQHFQKNPYANSFFKAYQRRKWAIKMLHIYKTFLKLYTTGQIKPELQKPEPQLC